MAQSLKFSSGNYSNAKQATAAMLEQLMKDIQVSVSEEMQALKSKMQKMVNDWYLSYRPTMYDRSMGLLKSLDAVKQKTGTKGILYEIGYDLDKLKDSNTPAGWRSMDTPSGRGSFVRMDNVWTRRRNMATWSGNGPAGTDFNDMAYVKLMENGWHIKSYWFANPHHWTRKGVHLFDYLESLFNKKEIQNAIAANLVGRGINAHKR